MLGKTGFRSEAYSGSGVRNILDVMRFEILELENTDILSTCLENPLIKDEKLRADIEKAIADLEDCDSDIDLEDESEGSLYWLVNRIVIELRKNSGKDLKYALWLASREEVLKNDENGGYGAGLDPEYPEIDEYATSDIVLSDIGNGGALYAYEDYPKPIKHDETEEKILTEGDIVNPTLHLQERLDAAAQQRKDNMNV